MKDFTPIPALFSEAWILFKKSVVSLFFLTLFTFAIYFLLFIAGAVAMVVVAGGAGIFKLLSGDTSAVASLLTPTVLLTAGILLLVFFLASFVIGLAVNAATILFVSGQGGSFGSTVKKGFGLVGALFIVSLLTGLLTWGSFFVFLIPGFIVAFFFSFVAYEVILAGKRGTEALRGSVQIIGQNFIDVVVRALTYFFMYICIAFILPNLLRRIDPSVQPLVSGLSFFVNMFLGWYGVAFSVALYNQAKAHTDTTKKTSLAWIVVLSIVGWILAVLLMIGVINFLKSPTVKNYLEKVATKGSPAQIITDGLETSEDEDTFEKLSQVEADQLAQSVFLAANAYRQENDMTPIEADGRLCAYAQRRLAQLDELGRYDDRKGFYEDIANDDINQAYFSEYAYLNEGVWIGPDTSSDPELIVDEWTTGPFVEKDKAIIANPDFDGLCIRANPNWLVMVGGSTQ